LHQFAGSGVVAGVERHPAAVVVARVGGDSLFHGYCFGWITEFSNDFG